MYAPNIYAPDIFSARLYEKMKPINPGLADLELYEFRYALANLIPENGWASVTLDTQTDIEQRISTRDFYIGIQLKPRVDNRIVLDAQIVRLTDMLFVGLVTGEYSDEWVRAHFYFDVRGFYFLARTIYFTDAVLAHFGGQPWKSLEQKQKRFEQFQGIGYKAFSAANAEVDQVFIESVHQLIATKGTPILITLAGPTAAGKTEIVERLRRSFEPSGRRVASMEMDNFLLDNDYRDEQGIHSLGKEAYHFEIFQQSLATLLQGKPITIPRYDSSISSHAVDGHLKPGYTPIEVEPADIIFLEGNFPFQIKDVNDLIGIKIVYLTDDPIRLKRKWKRDMDYRKKYDLNYFRNRFFRTQFLRAQDCYVSQMQVCDLVVDTTGAAIWATPDIAQLLQSNLFPPKSALQESNMFDPTVFSAALYEKMKCINAGIDALELYEFRYGLNNLMPKNGWASVELDTPQDIEQQVNRRDFYDAIQIKPRLGDRIVLDQAIVRLTNMLLAGLATGAYSEAWVNAHFYFDLRGFFFLHRTTYFTDAVLAHLGGQPFKRFEQRQRQFERFQDIGYRDFRAANAEVDQLFMESVRKLIAAQGTPILLAMAGPTAAGKTEIVARLQGAFEQAGQRVSSIELDNFLTDRDYREAKGIHTEGKRAIHFELFKQSLEDICHGKKIAIPRYDFVYATSSHDLDGNLKPGGVPIEIEPADIIFIEGNFPFLIQEVVHLIGIKVVYLTDDPIRLKRKWKRDIDYRKKYEPTYFRNRYFKDQFIMAEIAYRPQMQVCDMVVDTTGAALWTTPEIAEILKAG